jgi:hypothetical protein
MKAETKPMQTKEAEVVIPEFPKAKRPLQLMPSEHYTRSYTQWVPTGTFVEQVCEPAFWSNVAKKLQRGDEIKVMPDDMAWRAVLLVRASGRLESVVQVIAYDVLGAAADISAADVPYEVRFINSDRKWGVFMRNGGELVRDEFQVREQAERYMKNHIKVMAA